MSAILILGSGPNVVAATDWPRTPFDRVVAINNAWRVRPDWDDLVIPWDFPKDRLPPEIRPSQRLVDETTFMPAQNAYGGVVYAGGTMAFTTAYWALHTYRPELIAFLGCDMVYDGPVSHFYGKGTADPLRSDITLQSLEAKSARFMVLAAREGCAVVNLSEAPSRLVFPRATRKSLLARLPEPKSRQDRRPLIEARVMEQSLDYRVPSGRYWEEADRFDAAHLRDLDALWLTAAGLSPEEAARTG